MRGSTIEPSIAGITASVPAAWPPSKENVVPLVGVTAIAAVVLGGLQLWIRRHASLRITPEGLDVAAFWGRQQIPWHAIRVVRGNGRAGITIESTMGSFSLAVLLFRPTNGLVNALEDYVGACAVELPRLEE